MPVRGCTKVWMCWGNCCLLPCLVTGQGLELAREASQRKEQMTPVKTGKGRAGKGKGRRLLTPVLGNKRT